MNPINFPQANRTYTKPPGMTDEECAPLRVYDTGSALISCWQAQRSERAELERSGRVWLWVIGRQQPPVALHARSPFEQTPIEEATPDLDVADAQQAFIDGLAEKLEKSLLRHDEATAILTGRLLTLMMESVEECVLMEKAEENLVTKQNCAMIAGIGRGMVAGLQRQLRAIMERQQLVQVVRP